MSDDNNANQWTAKQRVFLEWLSSPSWDRLPITQQLLAVELGVAEETLCRWKKLPGFEDELFAIIKARIGDALPDVMGSFKAEAKKGQFQHQQMYLEMIGWYTKKQENSGTLTIRLEYADPDPNAAKTP